jgi:hypothetical protein
VKGAFQIDAFIETSIILLPKRYSRKEIFRPISPMNMVAKIINKYSQIKSNITLKRSFP